MADNDPIATSSTPSVSSFDLIRSVVGCIVSAEVGCFVGAEVGCNVGDNVGAVGAEVGGSYKKLSENRLKSLY